VILQRIGNRGLFLGGLFDEAAQTRPYLPVTLDHQLDIAPELGSDLTVYDCANLIAELASALRQQRVRPGDRVAIYKRDGFDIFLLACAVSRAGAVPVALSPALPGDIVAELLERCGWPALITDEHKLTSELPGHVRERAAGVMLASGAAAGSTPLRPDRHSVPRPFTRPSPRRPALITHTSGTTDVPKLAVHTALSLGSRYRPQAAAARLLIRRRETLALHVSFVHSRLVTALAIALKRGFPLVIVSDPDPARVAALFARTRPGILEAHPNTFVAWESLIDDPREPLAGVKYVSSTFDAIHPRTVTRLLRASRRSSPLHLQLYGQSEVGPIAGRVCTRRRGENADWRCVGFAFPGMTSLRVTSRNGKPPSSASPGFIEVRTGGRVQTYLGEDERFQRQVSGSWWRMGDVGYRTRWGCLHMCDRDVDVIPSFGSTLEVEDELMCRLDSLLEVVIVPDGDGQPTPVVVTRDDSALDPATWREAATGLPDMRPPVQVSLADLPRTATAKVRRLELARSLRNPTGAVPAKTFNGREASHAATAHNVQP
jgi:acyl-coenzyme A synthetase/AMP-(fatty) acid ligase